MPKPKPEARKPKPKPHPKPIRNPKDTHEFVAFFQREMEIKDEIIVTLNAEFEKTKLGLEMQLKAASDASAKALKSLRDEKTVMENNLAGKLKATEEELNKVETFRDQKHQMEATLAELRSQITAMEANHAEDMLHQERKFLADKARTQKEIEETHQHIRREARLEAQSGLDADTRRIVNDNRRMAEELRFQQQITSELEADKDRLEAECSALRRDVSLMNEAETLTAKQGTHRTKEVKALRAENAKIQLELDRITRQAREDLEQQKGRSVRELEEHKLDSLALRKLLKLKNKELRHIRRLAQTILEQRTETEQFFLESIEEVRRHKKAAARDAAIKAKAEYNESIRNAVALRGQFPPIKPPQELQLLEASIGESTSSALPANLTEKVEFGDLQWDDKERVLRLLFAKINAVEAQGIQAMPEHPLTAPEVAPPGGGTSAGMPGFA